jgi:hypothetical protein
VRYATLAVITDGKAGAAARVWCAPVPSSKQASMQAAYVDGFTANTLGHTTAVRPEGSRGGTG